MYVTTEAVESFVEEHYLFQIGKLEQELAEAAAVAQQAGKAAGRSSERIGKEELLRMLRWACDDEVHHKEEAAERKKEGSQPWFAWVDPAWQWLVFNGSALAAGA